jgi:hypothetical protein
MGMGDAFAERGQLPYDESRKHFTDSDELCDYVARATGGVCLLGFSAGKDSIGSWLQLRRFFRVIMPVYFYYVPGLHFVDESLRYYEDYFGQRIHRFPDESLQRAVTFGLYQAPVHHNFWKRAVVHRSLTPDFVFNHLRRQYLAATGGASRWALKAEGRRKSDSMRRNFAIMKHGSVVYRQRKFYPIFDWKNDRVAATIRDAGLKLPVDYRLFCRTFEGPRAEQLAVLREVFPDDYARVLDYYPLAEADELRRNFFATERLAGY